MGRKPTKAKAAQKATSELLASLEFISLIKKDSDTSALFRGGQLVATDNVVTVGIPVSTDLNACPHLEKTVAALRICGQSFDITQLPEGAIAIKGGSFRARIPCISADLAPAAPIMPDQGMYAIDSRFTAALSGVAAIATENATRLVETTILCRNGTVVASDGKIILEIYHGIAFPQIILPKHAATLLAKTKKEPKLFGVGYNQEQQISSITFHFEDGSWLKSQLYTQGWPDIDRVLAANDFVIEALSSDFFDACANIGTFAEDGKAILLDKTTIKTSGDTEGASQVLGTAMSITAAFNPTYIKFLSNYVDKIGYSERARALFFFGDTARAALMTMR